MSTNINSQIVTALLPLMVWSAALAADPSNATREPPVRSGEKLLLGIVPGEVAAFPASLKAKVSQATDVEGRPYREVLFLGDFEHGPISLTLENADSPWYASGNPPIIVTVPEPVRHGRYAMKSVLDRLSSPISYRTEVVPRIDDKARHAKIGEDYWYGFSVYFPQDWRADTIWEIVAQWHGRPDKELGEVSRNPVMAFHSDGTNLKITNIWDAQPHTQEAQTTRKTKYDGGVTLWEGPIHKGQWTDWVVHVTWSYKHNGVLEIWKNGERIASRKGPNTFNDKRAPYFKMGIYKGWRDRQTPKSIVNRRVVYHDEVRFAGPGGNYKDVAPPGSRPRADQQKRPPVGPKTKPPPAH